MNNKLTSTILTAVAILASIGTINAQDPPTPAPLTITTTVPSSMEANRVVKFQITATGGVEPYSWSNCPEAVKCTAYAATETAPAYMEAQWPVMEPGQYKMTLVLRDKNKAEVKKEYMISVTQFVPNLMDLWNQQTSIYDRANGASRNSQYIKEHQDAQWKQLKPEMDFVAATQLRQLKRERYVVYGLFFLGLMVLLNFILIMRLLQGMDRRTGFGLFSRVWPRRQPRPTS